VCYGETFGFSLGGWPVNWGTSPDERNLKILENLKIPILTLNITKQTQSQQLTPGRKISFSREFENILTHFEGIGGLMFQRMKKSPKLPRYCPAWYVQVAEGMVRNNTSLKQSALDLSIQLDPDEVVLIERRKEFQDILRDEKSKYYAAVANDPARTKSTAMGMMWVNAERLMAEGESERASTVLEKLAKVAGWTSPESNVNVFADLSARDIAEARAKILKDLPVQKPAEA
jgi:hypothetical protein